MARILIVTWDGGGNVPPMLGIAGELQCRGHEVRVLGHAQQREVVVSAGLKFIDYKHARPWSPKVAATGARFLLRILFGVFTDLGPGRDVREELSREPVDLVLVDSMILAGIRAAERVRVPTVVLMHTLRRFHTHEWSRGPIGVVAAVRGMRPGRLWNAADRVLVASDPTLDPSAKRRLPANVRYTGVVQAPIQSGSPQDKPFVLVSLSTNFLRARRRRSRQSSTRWRDYPSGPSSPPARSLPTRSKHPPTWRCTSTCHMTRSCHRRRWSSAMEGIRPQCARSPTGCRCSSCPCTASSISR